MKNAIQFLNAENARACRSKAASLREGIDEGHSKAFAVKMRTMAQQWADLAADYEMSILKYVVWTSS
jgi:hypothetical protein